jgi:glycine/D-amino acid oxidase-like deaminating enzyme
LDTGEFTAAVRKSVGENNFLNEHFSESELAIEANSVRYRDWTASKIIFCNGIQAANGRYFSWLPIRPLKGETLTLQCEEKIDKIFIRGVYVVPGIWKVGSTYNFADTATGVTEKAREELTIGLKALIRFSYSIKGQSWGFRPTTPDRRPILGAHPEYKNLVIFNGLGTKGVSLAPYFSAALAGWLENGSHLNNAVAIERYKSLYWKSS